jgi:hypothetical protein
MTLSDLDLVNQAMAAESTYTAPSAPSAPTSATTTATTTNNTDSDPLADLGVDLSNLSEADRAALKPILDALRASGGDENEMDVDDILRQLEAAGGAADVLEGRLDALLAYLGELEAEQKKECEGK